LPPWLWEVLWEVSGFYVYSINSVNWALEPENYPFIVMLHELLAYFAGSLILFALSSKGWFTVVGISSVLVAAVVWWGCGVFGALWYTPFTRRPVHWLWSGLAAASSILFVWLLAASAYVPQISAVSALVWRAELTFDKRWGEENFRKVYEAVEKAGHEDFTNYPFEEGIVPTSHPESIRISAKTTAENAHRHFRTRRPLLSRAYWSNPSAAAKMIEQRSIRHFQGETGQKAGESSVEILLDITEDIPVWAPFLAEINRAATGGGLLGWLLEGAGIDRGIGGKMGVFDERLRSIEEAQAEAGSSKSLLDMDYAILANEILVEAREKGYRVRRLVTICLVGLWVIALGIPFTLIGQAARREADLTRHQPVRYGT